MEETQTDQTQYEKPNQGLPDQNTTQTNSDAGSMIDPNGRPDGGTVIDPDGNPSRSQDNDRDREDDGA